MAVLYDLKLGYPDIRLVPRERFGALAEDVLRSGRGWQYGGDLQGSRLLREQLAGYMSQISHTTVTSHDLMITSGAIPAVDLLCRALTQPGDVVVVEDPTFYFIVNVLRLSHVEVVGVPLCTEGIDLDALRRLVDHYGKRLRVVYTIPSYHNPTGITATNRAALAEMARHFDFTIIEDATYQPLYYDAPPPPYLKTYDDSGHVVMVGSMSKVLMPAMRMGWIWALPEQIQQFKQFKDDAGSALTAEIVADFIRSGEFVDQVEYARRLYAGKHARAVAALDRWAPDWLEWSAPGGGFFIWATLPEPLTAARLEPFAAEREVRVFAGRDSYVAPPDDQHLRLCFAMLEEDALEAGIARLSEALHAAMKVI